MFLTIHGSIFHDEVGHWLANPRTKTKICVIYILPKKYRFTALFPLDIHIKSMYSVPMIRKELVAASAEPMILSLLAGARATVTPSSRKSKPAPTAS